MSNKVSSIVLERFKNLTHCEQALIMSEVFSSDQFDKFQKEANKKGKPPNKVASDFLRRYLSKNFETNTVYGRRLALKTDYDDDRLDPISVWMPNGRFNCDKSGFYKLLGNQTKCNRAISEIIKKSRYMLAIKKWDSIKPYLMSPAVGVENYFVSPRLWYEPNLHEQQSVYFLLDESKGLVKIGISKNINNRMDAVKREYKTGPLTLLTVVLHGGLTVERSLHKKFSDWLVDGKGREWFKYEGELVEFIDELSQYTIKSEYLEAVGII
ncbi:GIY-YIG nuclease family protein [Vibrio sp. vnigr-6D03]|uniref:GIY-YIG nuclease family protein n=1 Tax=Vibrio sp. vnigr-6D03 TaxID=2058088 RepID=UPI0015E0A2ED|nr:GIY-YIG nuclease family protein [Vibrio sp. vnigr-6D03]